MSHRAYREQKQHSTLLTPYSFLYGVMPDYYPSIGQHCHPEFELYVFAEGRCRFQIGETLFTAQKDDLVLVQPDVMHSASPINGERVAYDIVLFHPQLVTGGIEDRIFQSLWQPLISGKLIVDGHITQEHPYYPALRRAADHAVTCVRNPNIPNELLLRSSLLELFYLLHDSGSIHEQTQSADIEESHLSLVIDYIRTHYMQPLTVEELAGTVHLSKSYFMGSFRKTYGMSAIAYVHHVRIEAACELLRHTSESITDIALQSGYQSIANFNRHFQKEVGMTPGEYRRAADSREVSIYDMQLVSAYEGLVTKAQRHGKQKSEVDALIRWLTNYTQEQLEAMLNADISYQAFFEQAPQIHPDARNIRGMIGGMRVERIEEPLMQQIRWLEKLVDDLVRGRLDTAFYPDQHRKSDEEP